MPLARILVSTDVVFIRLFLVLCSLGLLSLGRVFLGFVKSRYYGESFVSRNSKIDKNIVFLCLFPHNSMAAEHFILLKCSHSPLP